MYNKKFTIVYDKTKKSIRIKNILLKKIIVTSPRKSDVIIVLGGDGFMLKTLKKYYRSNKKFYGINTGNYGFLMNKFSPSNFINKLLKARMISISPLEMRVNTKKNIKKRKIKIE